MSFSYHLNVMDTNTELQVEASWFGRNIENNYTIFSIQPYYTQGYWYVYQKGRVYTAGRRRSHCLQDYRWKYDVYYQDEKFTLVKRFAISDDIDRNLLLKACTQALDEIFMFRCYTHCYDDKTTLLCFEVETYVNSLKELERFFPQYLNVINHAIERQREIYYQMLADSKQHEMGSVTTTAKELKVVS